MNPNEAKKMKRRKNKKCEPSMAVGNHGKLIIDATITLPDEKILNTNQTPNSEVMSKIEQMMDSGDNPVPCLEMSQEDSPYFITDKCLICHREKGALSALPPHSPIPENCKGVPCWDLSYDINSLASLQLWLCPDCRCNMEERKRDNDDLLKLNSDIDLRIPMTDHLENSTCLPLVASKSIDEVGLSTSSCPCKTCVDRRKLESVQEWEAIKLHQYWSELRLAVRQVYQDEGIGCSEDASSEKPPSLEKLKRMVHKLCLRNPHQLFIWLEALARELIIEMKISLLKQLGNVTKLPQHARAFIKDLLDDYAKLCSACKRLHPILVELEQDHLKTLSLSWELVNRHLFQNLVYSDHRLQSSLPCLISQLRASVINDSEETQLKVLLQKYLVFDEQMTIVAAMWRQADPLLQEFHLEQATMKPQQRILHADWELFKMKHKIVEQQMLKKTDVPPLRFLPNVMPESNSCLSSVSYMDDGLPRYPCEYCNHQCTGACSALPHPDSSSQPAPNHGMMREANGHYLPNNFMSSMMNNMESLESVLCSAPPSPGLCLSKVKQHWCGGLQASLNGTAANLISGSVTEEEARLWVQSLPVVSGSPAITPPSGVLDVQVGADDELNMLESAVTPQDCVGCPTGNQDCQCHLCVATKPVGFVSNSSISSEKPSAESSCECHVCVKQDDRATIPTVVSAPPRPAALHLYPHIHGSNANHILHNPHLFKPFLHQQLYGLHLPRSKLFENSLFESDSMVAPAPPHPPSLNDVADTYRGSHDWDIVYENAKLLLNSRKFNDASPTLPQMKVSNPEDAVKLAGNMSVITGEETCKMLDVVMTHSNKATQASGPLPLSAGFPYLPLDFNHLKHTHSHNHRSLPSNCAAVLSEQDGTTPPCLNECWHGANQPFGTRSNSGAGKTPLHPCLAGHHNQPSLGGASKHPCKDFVFNLPETPESPLSICPNKDVENLHVDAEECLDDCCSEQGSSTATSNQKESKHCDCCYCEVFGHDVTAQPQMSRNYPEMRDKLRQRLNRRKMECKNEENIRVQKETRKPLEDCRDLDSLISFINGSVASKNECSGCSSHKLSSMKVLKKSIKKPRKVDTKQLKLGGGKDDLKEACFSSPLDEDDDRLDLPRISHHPVVLGNNHYYPKMEHQCTLAAPTIFTAMQGTTASVVKRAYSPATLTSMADIAKVTSLLMKPEAKSDVSNRCESGNVTSGHSQAASLSVDSISELTQLQICCLSPEVSVTKQSTSDCTKASTEDPKPQAPSSNTLPQASSPTLANEKAPKKKRKASQQSCSLSSSTSSSSSGISGCSSCSNWNASKEEILDLVPHFQQLKVTIADSKRNMQSPIKRAIGPTPPFSEAKCSACLEANTPPSTVFPNLICNGSDKAELKNRVSPVSNKVPVEQRTIAMISNSNHVVSTEPKRKERKKLDPVSNCQPSSIKNKPGGSDSKLNGKLESNDRDTCPSPSKTVGKNKRNKKKGGTTGDTLAIDDVFIPRDDTGEDLDPMDKEVEDFKRFCWNSKPLANKEKVNVNLKDILLRKKVATALECS